MASVFAGGQTHRGGFRADQLSLTIGGEPVAGFLIQQVQFQYAQQVSLLYEIGSNFVYYVGGRAQGTASIGHIIGPSDFALKLLDKYKDLCYPQDISFKAGAGCDGPKAENTTSEMTYTLEDAVMTTISVSVTAQDVVINQQLQFMFIDLDRE
jgi:hypothetical protein